MKYENKNDIPEGIAYCGVDCSICPDYLSETCPGCRKTDWKKDDMCLPVHCCREQNISCCGYCRQFPCQDMSEFYRESRGHEEAYERMRQLCN